RCGVVEERVIPKRDADLYSRQFVQTLVHHQDIATASPRELQRLLARPGPCHLVTPLDEHTLQGAAKPFIATSDQGDHCPRIDRAHDAVTGITPFCCDEPA